MSYKFEQAPGVADGQGCLVCCSPWGHKESDMTEQLNWTELKSESVFVTHSSHHWRRKWQFTPVFLPGKSTGEKSLVGYSPWYRKESDNNLACTQCISLWSSLFSSFYFDHSWILTTLSSPPVIWEPTDSTSSSTPHHDFSQGYHLCGDRWSSHSFRVLKPGCTSQWLDKFKKKTKNSAEGN